MKNFELTTLEKLEELYWNDYENNLGICIENYGLVEVDKELYSEFFITETIKENCIKNKKVYVKITNSDDIKKMFSEINNLKIIVNDEEKGVDTIELMLTEIVEKYGFQINLCDFDHYRIYHNNYQNKVWEIQYVCSAEKIVEPYKKDNEEFYIISIKC